MDSKLRNQTYQALNFPAHLTLVKSVLQAMPSYVFSVLSTPKSIIKKVQAIQRNFLWGSSEAKQKWALVDWETVCKQKCTEGLGIRDPEVAKRVMSAKIWWQWVTHTEEPWVSFWNVKYAHGWQWKLLIRYDESIVGWRGKVYTKFMTSGGKQPMTTLFSNGNQRPGFQPGLKERKVFRQPKIYNIGRQINALSRISYVGVISPQVLLLSRKPQIWLVE